MNGLLVGFLVKVNGFSKFIWRCLEGKCVVIFVSFFFFIGDIECIKLGELFVK